LIAVEKCLDFALNEVEINQCDEKRPTCSTR
jgi:hypothetical protein